jgi:hypothetical protein
MTATVDMAAELEAIRTVKARYCRFLDTKDADGLRSIIAPDVVMEVDLAVSTEGQDPMTAPPYVGANAVISDVFAILAGVATVHHCHTSEIELTSETTAAGIWAMEDRLYFPDGRELHGAGHYHETYEKNDGTWRIKTLHLTRTLMEFLGDWAE